MNLLLDQGLPRSAAVVLRGTGVDAIHVGDVGLSTATDIEIIRFARERGQAIVKLDTDFHSLLALSGARSPSVIRIEGLRGDALANILRGVMKSCAEDLEAGAAVSVDPSGVRLRRLQLASR